MTVQAGSERRRGFIRLSVHNLNSLPAVRLQRPNRTSSRGTYRFAVHRGDDISENNVASETPAGRSQTCFGCCAARRNLQRRNI
jgi:hypothetical protein